MTRRKPPSLTALLHVVSDALKVRISVQGGVAYVEDCPDGVKVEMELNVRSRKRRAHMVKVLTLAIMILLALSRGSDRLIVARGGRVTCAVAAVCLAALSIVFGFRWRGRCRVSP
jgi:hypothetical protein